MPRPDPISAGHEKTVRPITDFAADLASQLRNPRSPELLLAEISSQTSAVTVLLQNAPLNLPSKTPKDLERLGRGLWNLCIRLKREDDDKSARTSRLLSRTRLFAFNLLELGRHTGRAKTDHESEVVYLMGLAMTLGRLCLDGEDLDSARAVLQRAAEYVELLKAIPRKESDKYSWAGKLKLEADYLSLRMALSWKEKCIDVAEHIFRKTEDIHQKLDATSAENMADTVRHIGSSCLAERDFTMAIKWLKRAYNVMNSQSPDRMSVEGQDTRLAICQDLVQSFLGLGSTEAISEADNLVSCVESEIGDKPIVLHWRLEILQKSTDETFDADIYAGILRRMVRVFDFTDQTFHLLLHHIKELRNKTPRLACGLLDELLMQRVLRSENIEWLNKAVVRRVWMSTMDADPPETNTTSVLQSLFDSIREAVSQPLNPDVAGAVQSLVWKKIESVIPNRYYETADKWCLVALHDLFSNCGNSNRGKFTRKRILCAIGLNDAEGARAVFAGVPEPIQNEPLTRYLMFKASLLDWDSELGCRSIEHLAKSVDNKRCNEMLYACIREAQQSGDKLCTLAALKTVALAWDPVNSPASCLTSIIRGSIRLISLMEKEQSIEDQRHSTGFFVEDTCKLFELAANRARQGQKDKDGNKIFTVPELNWFRKNAYNIGVAKCNSSAWDLHNIVRIFNACLDFMSCYPPDISCHKLDDVNVMAMRCHFVVAAALVSLARTEDKVDERSQRYLEMRQHIASFESEADFKSGKQHENVARDLKRKMSTLYVFDFEGAVALKDWDNLSTIVRKADIYRDEASLKAMGDCLLRSQASGRVMFTTMRLIINEIFKVDNLDCDRLAKYIRCLFQATLPLDDTLAFQLLKEASDIARQTTKNSRPLPSAEIEWLAATAFNHAIDYYANGQEDMCHQWALAAIDLALHMDDGGRLRDLMQDKFVKLRFAARKK